MTRFTPTPAQLESTVHPQVIIKQGELSDEVDQDIAPLILELWKAGLSTIRSCQDHFIAHKVWIEFASVEDGASFLNIVAGRGHSPLDLWRRANAWAFGSWERTAGTLAVTGPAIKEADSWEYHVTVSDDAYDNANQIEVASCPDFTFGLSVLFPKRDLAVVVQQMRVFNDLPLPGSEEAD